MYYIFIDARVAKKDSRVRPNSPDDGSDSLPDGLIEILTKMR